jgi:hypothetical protein
VIEEKVRVCPHHRLPIVAVTADVMKGTHEQCFSAGMDDYIPKVNIFINLHSESFYYVSIFSMVGILNQEIYQYLIAWNVKNADLVLVLCAAS